MVMPDSILIKMKKNSLTLIIAFLVSFNLNAQQGAEAIDKKAREILNTVSSKYKSFKSLKASFVLTIENQKDKSKETQKGTIQIKGNKYKLEIAGQDVYSDGKTRWTYMKESNEVQIDNQKTDENAVTPASIFTIYEKGWKSKFVGEEKDKNLVYQLIELVPVDPSKKNIFKIKIKVNKNDKFIANAIAYDKNGGIQTFKVESLTPDVVNNEGVFTFNESAHPGVEKIDLR